jgi:ketosteroid isomerase-like protein
MSQENVEIVRKLFGAFNPDWDLDAASELWDPDISWRAIEGAPDDVGEMRGRAALRSYYEQWTETFDALKAEAVELRASGDAVVAAVRVGGRMKGSAAEIDMRVGVVYELADGKVTRGREYATFEEALEAVGLSE